MRALQETSWTLIRDAAAGSMSARSDFSRRYLPVVRAYLAARWRGGPFEGDLDDAVQDVFLDCFREGGVIERADPSHGSGFRAFLFGVVRNTALRIEERRARESERREGGDIDPERFAAREERLSGVFDRAWALAVMREAAELQAARAREKGPEAAERVELLRLRFHEGMAIRDIALLWGADPARLHHDYAQARLEFMSALREVVGLHERCPAEQLEAECARLLDLLKRN
jgi:RNA polymerase sigma-70 factor (ECF subfamily)